MPTISYGQKLFFLATVPLILAAAAIAVLISVQTRQLSEQEVHALEQQLLSAKEAELKNYMNLARTAFINIYGRAPPDDEAAKLLVTQILSSMVYGSDGFFFVYDYDGNNLVSPRQTYLITNNWLGLNDINGVPVVDRIIEIARNGAGYHRYVWPKPSTGGNTEMVTYVVGLQDWRWAIGTGVFIDDVLENVTAARAATEARIRATFVWIVAITGLALLVVFTTGQFLNVRERRLADAKLKQLTQRIIDTQEEERGRVARELHDGISQLLVGVRYTLELASRRLQKGDTKAAASLSKSSEGLNVAINEVRRISHDLRPGVLDDLGLGPALKNLVDGFAKRSGISVQFETVVFRNRLDHESKTALFRVAQEALMNIERHAGATNVSVNLFGHKKGATLRLIDNGVGMNTTRRAQQRISGLGLRNMQERIEQLDGTLTIQSSAKGTMIEATVPLTHLLAPTQHKKAIPA